MTGTGFAFETLAIHAGHRARPADRRGHPADLPDVHLRARRRRRDAGRLRVLPHRQPDPDRPGGVPGGARGGPAGSPAAGPSPSPPGWPPRTACCARPAGRATTSSSRPTPTAAPTGCSRRCSSRWGLTLDAVALDDIDAVRAALASRPARLVWAESPDQPAAARARPARRWPRTAHAHGRAARRRQHVRLALPAAAAHARAPTSSSTPPPSTWAGTPTWSAARWWSPVRALGGPGAKG